MLCARWWVFQLNKYVKADGNVEVWLMSLMRMAHYSLHVVIRTAAMAIQDPSFQLLEFLNMFPAQVRYSTSIYQGYSSGGLRMGVMGACRTNIQGDDQVWKPGKR